ncbi:molybdenum ABC transporter ATP-binding protein [Zhongshania aquimaris]|uniref:Molybdenum ABC transporter ATP-binding protein n=1 Tax=Zhongshania aquimaris TaxID=2857107 RepID=A0ABS6VVG4_9GAMM|nr:molybdenum ABC transporter ATP-binding protein [Zhongshania aquimaris]MBW2942335.1 molybdenum ABC transporter ATP-binding protein [Zhongshania aquimaris]
MSLLLSLHMERGEFSLNIDTALPTSGITAICGPSGSGKTTLLRCIAGLDIAPNGMVQFAGDDWQTERTILKPEQRGIGIVFQDAQLFPHLKVRGNLEYAFKRRFSEAGPSIEELCDWLEITQLLDRAIDNLSGGERKRVAIARALLRHPQLLLMDEPLTGLHDSAREQMVVILQRLARHLAIPILYVSHSFHEISRLADHVLLMESGQLIAEGDLITLSTRLDLPLSKQQGAGAVINAQLHGHDPEYQLSTLTIDTQHQLTIKQVSAESGQQLRLFVAARDVSIALEAPQQSSIMNILPCKIDTIEQATSPPSSAQVTIRLQLNEQYLLAHITRKSCDRLQLQQGQHVFAQIKTVALINEYGTAT